MNVKKFEFSSEEREEILKEYQLDHPVCAYKRLLALKLKAIDGMRSDEVAKVVGIEHSTVNRIVKRYQAEEMQLGWIAHAPRYAQQTVPRLRGQAWI